MNVNMMLRVAAHIEAHPEGYDQNAWCGTACCIAGTAVMLDKGLPDGNALLNLVEQEICYDVSIPLRARKILDVDKPTAARLFGSPRDWPFPYRFFDYRPRHLQAAAYLRSLVAEYEATLVPIPVEDVVAPVAEEELVLA
jgi:hypothetical protein